MSEDDSRPGSDKPPLLKPALMLGALGLAAAVLLGGLDELTRERIAEQERDQALRAVAGMLDAARYDNDLLADTRSLAIPGLEQPATVYRARRGGEPTAAVLDLTTTEGYSGPIRLLLAVDTTGTVLGVRVVEHRETPGLGDAIERSKSDWIEQFEGRSLGNPPVAGWKADRRDGEFDTLTSATITSTAVITAVGSALQAFAAEGDELFARDESPDTEG
jgi:electron transport complex protein RnfG